MYTFVYICMRLYTYQDHNNKSYRRNNKSYGHNNKSYHGRRCHGSPRY